MPNWAATEGARRCAKTDHDTDDPEREGNSGGIYCRLKQLATLSKGGGESRNGKEINVGAGHRKEKLGK